jgi:uncharacterized membrane protein
MHVDWVGVLLLAFIMASFVASHLIMLRVRRSKTFRERLEYVLLWIALFAVTLVVAIPFFYLRALRPILFPH